MADSSRARMTWISSAPRQRCAAARPHGGCVSGRRETLPQRRGPLLTALPRATRGLGRLGLELQARSGSSSILAGGFPFSETAVSSESTREIVRGLRAGTLASNRWSRALHRALDVRADHLGDKGIDVPGSLGRWGVGIDGQAILDARANCVHCRTIVSDRNFAIVRPSAAFGLACDPGRGVVLINDDPICCSGGSGRPRAGPSVSNNNFET